MRTRITDPNYNGPFFGHTKVDVWEAYAREVLTQLDPAVYGSLKLCDRPDLQDQERSLGVEVSWAETPNGQEAQALYAELSVEVDELRRTKLIERIEKTGAVYGNGVLFGPNGHDSFNLILEICERKLKLLNSGEYAQLDDNQLFILASIYASEEMLMEALADMAEISMKYNKIFKKVIVSVPEHTYIFDLFGSGYEKKSFPRKVQRECSERARRIVIEAELK